MNHQESQVNTKYAALLGRRLFSGGPSYCNGKLKQSQTLKAWYILPTVPYTLIKCRWIYHTLSVWEHNQYTQRKWKNCSITRITAYQLLPWFVCPRWRYIGVSKNRGTPQIIHFNRVFHYRPSILGYPYFWKHPDGDIFYIASKLHLFFIPTSSSNRRRFSVSRVVLKLQEPSRAKHSKL